VEVCHLAGLIATAGRIAANHIRWRLVLSDSQLIARARDGDDEAFSEIVGRYQGFVYRQAWGYLRDDEAAKDATQEVFVTAYQGISYLRKNSALRRWLYRVCRNHCLNVIRRRKLEHGLRPEDSDAVKPDMALLVTLRERISDLDDPYREVIILRYYQDLSYTEIAQVLDISIDNVKTRLFRAKNTLKRMLGEKTDEMR
jgi:RNA polymerase sigma-70 factor (ECF subfamily)